MPNYPKTVNHYVTEKRAPTDESVKLLSEFEKEAASKVEKVLYLNNDLKGTMTLEHNRMKVGLSATFRFSINGKKCPLKLVKVF